jgi:hypothetical protein
VIAWVEPGGPVMVGPIEAVIAKEPTITAAALRLTTSPSPRRRPPAEPAWVRTNLSQLGTPWSGM